MNAYAIRVKGKEKEAGRCCDLADTFLNSRQEGAFAEQTSNQSTEDMEGGGEECDVRRSSRRRRGVKSYESKHFTVFQNS